MRFSVIVYTIRVWKKSSVETIQQYKEEQLGTAMKPKFISATLLVAVVILGATPSLSHAQFPSQPPGNMKMQGGIENIPGMNFTEEQKEKLQEVKKEMSDRMMEILTSEQQEYLKTAMNTGRNPQEVMKSLNLSRQQKQQLEDVQKWQRNQLFSILTNEQKQKMKEMMMRRQGGATPFGFRP
jgi:Spy/CpxP family protein refolding chaperone